MGLCGDLDGWEEEKGREVLEGEDIGIHIADSLHCAAETNTTLESNYTSIKKKKRFSLGITVNRRG